MSDLTLEQIDRIIANHESGVQLTGVNVYRQLAAVIREREALAGALIQIKDCARTYNQPDRRDLYKWINELGRIAEAALESVKPPR